MSAECDEYVSGIGLGGNANDITDFGGQGGLTICVESIK
jgi:hypothetical protein